MKKRFIAFFIVLIAAGLGTSYLFLLRQDSSKVSQKQNEDTVEPSDSKTEWIDFKDPFGLYTVSYPKDAVILTSSSTFNAPGFCILIFTKEYGQVTINSGEEFPCGGALYTLGEKNQFPKVTMSIDGKEYISDWMYRETSNSISHIVFQINPQLQVEYGVNANENIKDELSESIPLTEDEYTKALDSAKEILSTFKLSAQ